MQSCCSEDIPDAHNSIQSFESPLAAKPGPDLSSLQNSASIGDALPDAATAPTPTTQSDKISQVTSLSSSPAPARLEVGSQTLGYAAVSAAVGGTTFWMKVTLNEHTAAHLLVPDLQDDVVQFCVLYLTN